MLNFDFLDKGLGIVSPAHFVCDFWTKMLLMLYFIYWPKLKYFENEKSFSGEIKIVSDFWVYL